MGVDGRWTDCTADITPGLQLADQAALRDLEILVRRDRSALGCSAGQEKQGRRKEGVDVLPAGVRTGLIIKGQGRSVVKGTGTVCGQSKGQERSVVSQRVRNGLWSVKGSGTVCGQSKGQERSVVSQRVRNGLWSKGQEQSVVKGSLTVCGQSKGQERSVIKM